MSLLDERDSAYLNPFGFKLELGPVRVVFHVPYKVLLRSRIQLRVSQMPSNMMVF